MSSKKSLYFPAGKVKGKSKKEIDIVQEEPEQRKKLVKKIRGKKADLVVEVPEKLTAKEKQAIRTYKQKPKPEERGTKRKLTDFQAKLEKKEKGEIERLSSLKAIEAKRKAEQEERYGKPVQLPPEFYKLIEAIAPEKLKKSKEQELPSVKFQREQEEASKKLAEKMQKEEEEHQKKEAEANFSEIAKILKEQRQEQLEKKKEKEVELESQRNILKPDDEDESLPSYDDLMESARMEQQEAIKKDLEKRKQDAIAYEQAKKDNFKTLEQIFDRVKPKDVKFLKKPNFTNFNKLTLERQADILATLDKSANYQEFLDSIKDLTTVYNKQVLEQIKKVPELTDDDIEKMSAKDTKKFLKDNELKEDIKKTKFSKNYKAYLKDLMKRKKEITGKGLMINKKYNHIKKNKPHLLVGSGYFSDKLNKAIEFGKKAVEVGKTVYEVGKKGYEVGKQAYDVGKSAHEAYKKLREKKGGKLEGGIVSAAGLEKKKRGRPVKGGIMSAAGLDKSMEGGIVSAAGLSDAISGGIMSAAGLEGGIVSGAGVRGGSYALPLPNPKSARATYQSYF